MGTHTVGARSLASLTLACLVSVSACGSEDRGVTQPTPPSAAPPSVVQLTHYTLQPPDNRTPHNLRLSYLRPPGRCLAPCAADVRAYDDFTSATATTIRTVSWQGGYCRISLLPPFGFGVPPPPPPVAVSRSFEVSFYADFNGVPVVPMNRLGLYTVRLTPSEVREQLAFSNSYPPDGTCFPTTQSGTPTATYYHYTAVLPVPFPVTAGTRYWLSVQADTGLVFPRPADSPGDIEWGWRIGMRNNNRSLFNGVSAFSVTADDLAFSLSPE
jgi:hypothetical protein